MRLDEFAVDPAKLVEGVVWDFHTKRPTPDNQPHHEHIWFRLVPHSAEFDAALWARMEPHRPLERAGKMDPAVYRRIRAEVHAEHTFRGWGNIEIGGEARPFSRESAIELLTDPRWEIVRRFVESAVANEAALLAQQEADDRGN